MDLQLSDKRYQLDIPRAVWPEFFAQFTHDNRGRALTLKLRDGALGRSLDHRQLEEFELLRHTLLFSIIYDQPDHGNDLVVTVSRSLASGQATYAHRIVYPQTVSIITDEEGVIQSCTVTDDDHAQTIISFQP